MARSLVALLSLVSIFGWLSQATPYDRNSGDNQACQQLARTFGNKTSIPASPEYVLVAPENWSETCQLEPYCVFEPQTAQDVARALKILTATGTHFAVRGGGHMTVPNAANIDNGVLISLNQMTTMKLTQNNSIAQLGPGLRWGTVYDWISQYNLGVAGGRYNPVGVSGFLLGGGISYFGSKYGWSTSMIANLEVVLANGTIVNANVTSNLELFWALKGGSNNFGIVTRFDVKTFPLTDIYGGTTLYNPAYVTEFTNAIAAYVAPGGGSDDIAAAFNPSVQINVTSGALTLFSLSSHVGSDPAPAAFANFSKIPTVFNDQSVRPNLSALAIETSIPVYSERTHRRLFFATSLTASQESVILANQTFFATYAAMPQLKNVTGLTLTSTTQVITKAWLEAAQASGGDAMSLDPAHGGIMAYLTSTSWENASDDDLVYEFNQACIAAIDREAAARGLQYPFIFLNDAAATQKPFALYGQGTSLPKMRSIRKKYDPSCVFQRLMPGGFKLGCY